MVYDATDGIFSLCVQVVVYSSSHNTLCAIDVDFIVLFAKVFFLRDIIISPRHFVCSFQYLLHF